MVLRDLEIAERLGDQITAVDAIDVDPSSGRITVVLSSGQSLYSEPDADGFAEEAGAALGASNLDSEAIAYVPRDPSLDESWALLHYDLAMTLSALEDSDPPASVIRVAKEGDIARITVIGDGRLLVVEHELCGSTLSGIGAELLLRWNAPSSEI